MTESRPPVPPERVRPLLAYLAGDLRPEESREIEKETLADDALAELCYSLQGMDAILTANAPSETPQPASRPPERVPLSQRVLMWLRPSRVWAPAAAGVLIALLLVRSLGFLGDDDRSLRMRGPDTAPVTLAPVGDVKGAPDRFVWRSSPNAAHYRFRLLDASARLVYESVTDDTTLVLPAALLRDLTAGTWMVVTQDRKGAETRVSPPAAFRVIQP